MQIYVVLMLYVSWRGVLRKVLFQGNYVTLNPTEAFQNQTWKNPISRKRTAILFYWNCISKNATKLCKFHSLVHHSFTNPLVHSFVCFFIRSFILWLIHSLKFVGCYCFLKKKNRKINFQVFAIHKRLHLSDSKVSNLYAKMCLTHAVVRGNTQTWKTGMPLIYRKYSWLRIQTEMSGKS